MVAWPGSSRLEEFVLTREDYEEFPEPSTVSADAAPSTTFAQNRSFHRYS